MIVIWVAFIVDYVVMRVSAHGEGGARLRFVFSHRSTCSP